MERLTRDLAAGKLPQQQQAKSQARPAPEVYRHIIKNEWFREFTIRERLAILFGCNMVVMIGIATRHNPGAMQPLVLGRVSYQKNATDYMKSIVEGMLEERQSKGGARVENDPDKNMEAGK